MITTKSQRIILYALILIASAAWIMISSDASSADISKSAPAPQAGFPAPDFTLKTPTGEGFTLSEQQGQAVLVNLWATWCPPCRAEMPAIQKMYEEYKAQGFIVLAIDMTYQDDPFAVVPFINEHGLGFPILLDETSDVAQAYQIRSLPSSYFINRYGIITDVVIGGPMSEALLRTNIEKALE